MAKKSVTFNTPIKALTVYQPWASLIAVGAKKYETRSWSTNYRGRIAIHAGMKKYDCYDFLGAKTVDVMENALIVGGQSYLFGDLHFGAIIATAELVGCHEMNRNPEDGAIYIRDYFRMFEHWVSPNDNEFLFGYWQPGRYAWELEDVKQLPEPIPCRGYQRLWSVPEDVLERMI